MFKFVYAWQPGESWDVLAADGFVGVETDAELPPGVPRIGGRRGGGAYVIVPGPSAPAADAGAELRRLADGDPATTVLAPNAVPFTTAVALWTLLEAAHHERVKVLIDLGVAHTAGQSAAVLIPTLNLRIGLVRATTLQADVPDYARRLAGIGYDGYVVCDPPAGQDRPQAARELAAAFRGVFPAKPVKKTAAAKSA